MKTPLSIIVMLIVWVFTSSNTVEQVNNTIIKNFNNNLQSVSLDAHIIEKNNSKVELVSQNSSSLYHVDNNSHFNHTIISADFKKIRAQNKKLITEYVSSIISLENISVTKTQLPLNNNFK